MDVWQKVERRKSRMDKRANAKSPNEQKKLKVDKRSKSDFWDIFVRFIVFTNKPVQKILKYWKIFFVITLKVI